VWLIREVFRWREIVFVLTSESGGMASSRVVGCVVWMKGVRRAHNSGRRFLALHRRQAICSLFESVCYRVRVCIKRLYNLRH
jgi:hypothetical protein